MNSKSSSKRRKTTKVNTKNQPEKKALTKPLPLQAILSLKTRSGYGSLTRYSELISIPDLKMVCSFPVIQSPELSRVVALLERTSSVLVLTDRISRNIPIWEKSFKGFLSLDQVIFLLLATKLVQKSGSFKGLLQTFPVIQKELKNSKIPLSLAFPDMPS